MQNVTMATEEITCEGCIRLRKADGQESKIERETGSKARTMHSSSFITYKDKRSVIRKLATWILFSACFVHTWSVVSSSSVSEIRPSNETSIPSPSSTRSSSSSSSSIDSEPQVLSLDQMTKAKNSSVLKFHQPDFSGDTEEVVPVESNSVPHIDNVDKSNRNSDYNNNSSLITTTDDSLIPTTMSESSSSAPPPPKPKPTRRKIYIRGHLLSQSKSRRFHPADTEDQRDQEGDENGPIPQKHVGGLPKKDGDIECPPAAPRCNEDAGRSWNGTHVVAEGYNSMTDNKRKKKHNAPPPRKQFHNYNMLSDTTISEARHQGTEFYAWIFGAAMLGILTIVALTSCFAYFLCSEKWRQRRAMRRKWDKNGEYERVDSVSSIVDNSSMPQPPDYNDNDIDAVSII